MNAHEGPDAKRQKQFFRLSSEDLVQLFPLESSEVLVRCGQRHAGGGKEGTSWLMLRAGERFEVVVAIKSRLGPITGQHVEQMMRLIKIVLPGFRGDPGDGWSIASPDYKPGPAWIWHGNPPGQFLVGAPKEKGAQQSAATSHRSAKQDYDGVYNVSKGAPGKLHIVVGSWHMLRVCSRVQLTVLIMLTLQVGGSTDLRMDGCTTIIQIKQKRNG